MTDRRISALLLPTLVAGALLGLLAFLFVRSEPLGVAAGADALTILREMRDLDARLDAEALAHANDLAERAGATRVPASAARRATLFELPLHRLSSEPAHVAVAGELARLRAALDDKQRAYAALEAAHQRSRRALDDFEQALPADSTMTQGDRYALQLDHLHDAFRHSDVRDFGEGFTSLQALADTVVPSAAASRPTAHEIALHANVAAQAFLAARRAEADAWQHYRFATAGERITLTAHTLGRDIATTLTDNDRWRLYLYVYGAALLLALGYAGLRSATLRRALLVERDKLQERLGARSDEVDALAARLEATETRLVDAQRMSALGRMVAGVAHEIDAPLARAKASLDEARQRLPDMRDACECAQRLVELLAMPQPDAGAVASARDELGRRIEEMRDFRALDRLHGMVWDGAAGIEEALVLAAHLRSYSRPDASRVAGFNVNDGVAATLLIARPLLRRVDVDKALGSVPPITCSPAQVSQVLLALVTNALEAIDKPRGRLSIATRPAGPASVAIDIADNGRGIPPEQLPRIFDPRYATKDSRRDGGLGLSTAHTIVRRHGGRIDVKSEPAVGTTFTVTLPVEPPEGFERQVANS